MSESDPPHLDTPLSLGEDRDSSDPRLRYFGGIWYQAVGIPVMAAIEARLR